jgi:DNA repair protein RecO (recombination protein O)
MYCSRARWVVAREALVLVGGVLDVARLERLGRGPGAVRLGGGLLLLGGLAGEPLLADRFLLLLHALEARGLRATPAADAPRDVGGRLEGTAGTGAVGVAGGEEAGGEGDRADREGGGSHGPPYDALDRTPDRTTIPLAPDLSPLRPVGRQARFVRRGDIGPGTFWAVAVSAGIRTPALVLRVLEYGETSQIVHLATPDHGLVAAIAKGARHPKSAFQGGLSLGVLGEAQVVPRRGGDLETLRSFRETDAFRGLRGDLARFHAGQYVIGCLRELVRPALPAPDLFRAGAAALKVLSTASPESAGAWVVWFEARALAASGHRPQLSACAACGGRVERDPRFSPAAGGLVHAACAPAGVLLPLSSEALSALRRLYAARLPELASEPLTAVEVAAARRAHDAFVPHVLEREPRGLRALPR